MRISLLILVVTCAALSCDREPRPVEPTSFDLCANVVKKGYDDSIRYVSNSTVIGFNPVTKAICKKKGNNYGPNDSSSIDIKIILDALNFTNVSFSQSKDGYSPIKDIYFDRPVTFGNCFFFSDKIYNATFNDLTTFISNDSGLDFIWANFKDTLRFQDNGWYDSLTGELYFYESNFLKTVQFSGEKSTKDDVRFRHNYMFNIASNIFFERCALKKLEFLNCRFTKGNSLILENTNVDTIIFNGLKLQKLVDLTMVNSYRNTKCELYLNNVDIEKLKFRYRNFHLYFPDSILSKPNNNEIVEATYQEVLSNFKNNGYQESYEELDKEYKDWQSEHNFFLWISKLWWRYGYEKERILLVIIFNLLFFSLLNFVFYNELQKTYYIRSLDWKQTTFTQSKIPRSLKKWSLCFFYTCSIFFRLSLDFDKMDFSKTTFLILLLTQYTFGLLCTGYLVNWVITR